MPYDFFMSRYKEAYVLETLAFVESLVKGEPAPCTGEDGLIALVMAVAAGKSAEERRWVKFSELWWEISMLSMSGEEGVDDSWLKALYPVGTTNSKSVLS